MRTTLRTAMLTSIVLAAGGAAQQVQAVTITFDETITSPVPPDDFGGVLQYSTPSPTPPVTFTTQGFEFGGRTAGVLPGVTQPEILIMLDPTQCVPGFGVPCVDSDTNYAFTDLAYSLVRDTTGTYSFFSLSASPFFGPEGCPAPLCDSETLIPTAAALQLIGLRAGVIVADETLLFSGLGFETFVLTDPDWANVGRTVFIGLDATGAPGGVAAIDNLNVVNVTAVPEPATLLLFGSGIAALAAKRARGRKKTRF